MPTSDANHRAERRRERARYGGSVSIFPPEIVAAVLHHMNDDHLDDNLLIARAFGESQATSSVMKSLDGSGGTWAYSGPTGEHELTVPWSTEISERAEIRREIVVLYDTACARLGITPRPHDEGSALH